MGISPNATSALWGQIQQIILSKGGRTNNILVGNTPPYDKWNVEYGLLLERQIPILPTHIIVAPPFGTRFTHEEAQRYGSLNGLSLSEDLYLDLAINWVQKGGRVIAIVPEGLLVSGNRRNIRSLILNRMHVTAIISLGTFLPYTRVKSSILILDKKQNLEHNETFICHINEVTNVETFDSRNIPQIAEALNSFEQWSIKRQYDATPNSIIISSDTLDVNNMSFSHFMKTSDLEDDTTSQYATARLGDLTKQIRRGSSDLTLDPGGHLPIIGPAMIRPMLLDPEHFDHTTKEKIPPSAPTVQLDDIVINGISTYAGAAALVEENLQNLPISRHVFLVRPNPNLIVPEFLAIALNSTFVNSQIEATKSGTTIQGLKVSDLPNLIIPVPNKVIQHSLVERMRKARDEWFQAQDRLKSAEQAFTASIKDLSGWGLE